MIRYQSLDTLSMNYISSINEISYQFKEKRF